ncbi:MAG: DNA-binding response regulator [Balneolaceae bacterium]|nr:MAG: DNA-binding response regulator [Balneolaceae bacterium]
MSIRVIIVEDDHKIRKSLAILLDGSHGFRCIGDYESAEAALRELPMKKPDVVLMDIHLGGMSGIEAVREIKEILPQIQVIMLTVFEDSAKIFHALQAGAVGYLIKTTPADEILKAIRDVMKGGSPMSPQIARKVVQSFYKDHEIHDDLLKLTPREEEVLTLLARGLLYKEIANELYISKDTVHNHLRNIYQKLQVRTRTEAVVKYLKRDNL